MQRAASSADWDDALSLIDHGWVRLLQGSPRELLTVLDRMPGAVLSGRPRLRLAREHLARLLEGEAHASTYRLIIDASVPTDSSDQLALLTARIAAARSAGADVAALVAAAHELRGRQPVESTPTLAAALPEMHYQWGLALERSGDFDGALLDYVESFDWAVTVGHRMMQRASAGAIAYLHALHGRIVTAQTWIDKLPTPRPEDWWEPDFSTQARLAESLIRSAHLDVTSDEDLREDISANELIKHWAPYFLVRAIAVRDARATRRLRTELDTFVATLPAGQRKDPVNAALVDIARLLFAVRVRELGRTDSLDRPLATAHLLRQVPAVIRALGLAHAGRSRTALQIAAPLLHVDRSRPQVVVPALLATAIATDDPARRSDLLLEAVTIGHAHRYFTTFAILPADLRLEAALLLAALGETAIAERLTVAADEPRRSLPDSLTARERIVAEHAADGESSAEIAASLSVSVNTVKTQLRTVYRKLGITSRTELRHLHHVAESERS
ncbi:helix-turn-helix transcriptional regulator [Rathayibacter sp. Leaf294]|uniref:helix-turn-helix transcriptional regulator n=1 Tax=Rathayibacter sp. Leaf294 TaxID=1736326 RepID=UPI0006F9168C|nr:helix-turn-helix transcriptional regulator [Rathayibacter sp. Leaf294]KQQ05949.1 hypothetical protein ASF42_05265 [Rathayibacter sp. Leaf294]KQS13806.1 hypothetical protein ASG06_05275 [Rathayibacter sp. Leaf185]